MLIQNDKSWCGFYLPNYGRFLSFYTIDFAAAFLKICENRRTWTLLYLIKFQTRYDNIVSCLNGWFFKGLAYQSKNVKVRLQKKNNISNSENSSKWLFSKFDFLYVVLYFQYFFFEKITKIFMTVALHCCAFARDYLRVIISMFKSYNVFLWRNKWILQVRQKETTLLITS